LTHLNSWMTTAPAIAPIKVSSTAHDDHGPHQKCLNRLEVLRRNKLDIKSKEGPGQTTYSSGNDHGLQLQFLGVFTQTQTQFFFISDGLKIPAEGES